MPAKKDKGPLMATNKPFSTSSLVSALDDASPAMRAKIKKAYCKRSAKKREAMTTVVPSKLSVAFRDPMAGAIAFRFVTPTATFHPFPRLPLELRQKIIGLCSPAPGLLVQHFHRNPNQRFGYYRQIPPVLHVNQEFRTEFLGPSSANPVPDATVARMRKEHAVYTPAYIYKGLGMAFEAPVGRFSLSGPLVSVFAGLSYTLRYLAIRGPNVDRIRKVDIVNLVYHLPALERVTALLSNKRSYPPFKEFDMPPEVDGEHNRAALQARDHNGEIRAVDRLKASLIFLAGLFPDIKFPVWEFCFEKQFLADMGMVVLKSDGGASGKRGKGVK